MPYNFDHKYQEINVLMHKITINVLMHKIWNGYVNCEKEEEKDAREKRWPCKKKKEKRKIRDETAGGGGKEERRESWKVSR